MQYLIDIFLTNLNLIIIINLILIENTKIILGKKKFILVFVLDLYLGLYIK